MRYRMNATNPILITHAISHCLSRSHLLLGVRSWQISLHKECNQSSYTKCNQSPYTKCVTDLQYLPMCTYNFSLSRKKLIFNMRYRLSPTLSFHGAIHHCHCCVILRHCSHVEQRSCSASPKTTTTPYCRTHQREGDDQDGQ